MKLAKEGEGRMEGGSRHGRENGLQIVKEIDGKEESLIVKIDEVC